jgi:hypothetical protein
MMSLYAVQMYIMLCLLTLKLDGHLAGTLIFSWHFTPTCSKAGTRDTKQYVYMDCKNTRATIRRCRGLFLQARAPKMRSTSSLKFKLKTEP